MKPFEVFDFFAGEFASAWKMSLLQGVLFIGFGLLILFVPQLLVAMIAGFFILLGVIFLGVAWNARQFQKNYQDHFRVNLKDWP